MMFNGLNRFNAFQCSQGAAEIEQLIRFVKSHAFLTGLGFCFHHGCDRQA
jgi:hypothetical protein